jgi:hypothetical protein
MQQHSWCIIIVLQLTVSYAVSPKNMPHFFRDVIAHYESVYPVFLIQSDICEEETYWYLEAPQTFICYQNYKEVIEYMQHIGGFNEVDLLILVGPNSGTLLQNLERAGA